MARLNYQSQGSLRSILRAIETAGRLDTDVRLIPDAEVLILDGFTSPQALAQNQGWDLAAVKAGRPKLVVLTHPDAESYPKEWLELFAPRTAIAVAPKTVPSGRRDENDKRLLKILALETLDRISYSPVELAAIWQDAVNAEAKASSSVRNPRPQPAAYRIWQP